MEGAAISHARAACRLAAYPHYWSKRMHLPAIISDSLRSFLSWGQRIRAALRCLSYGLTEHCKQNDRTAAKYVLFLPRMTTKSLFWAKIMAGLVVVTSRALAADNAAVTRLQAAADVFKEIQSAPD